jgi:N-acyl-D-aspartate/D-glutamate deacylase
MQAPFVMLENDCAIEMDPETGEYTAHPRCAGSYSNFLGYWVRQRGVCDLMTALSKTSTMAAGWLGLDKKGRIQVGCDADLVLFDPETIIDTATYSPEGCMNPPRGLPHVIVNGVLVVRDGEITTQKPGRVIRRTWPVPGELTNHGIFPGKGIEALQ